MTNGTSRESQIKEGARDVERLKKLINDESVVSATELPSTRTSAHLAAEIEDALTRFENDSPDENFAHFIIKVRRNQKPLPVKSEMNTEDEASVSLESMVNETLDLTDQMTQSREARSESAEEYSADFLIENAKLLEASQEYELARNIYKTLVSKGSNITAGLLGIARTYEATFVFDEAERYYREALAYSSEVAIYQALVAVQIRIGKDDQAAQSLIFALGLPNLTNEQKFEFHKSLGNCHTRSGDHEKAAHHYRKSYELNPKSDVLQVNVGSLALQKSDLESARTHFQRALELNPRNEKAINGLGMVCFASGDIQKAHDFFVTSLELEINNVGAIYNLVKCAYELKSFDSAARVLERFIHENPSKELNINILYSFCGILYHQGQYNMALLETERVLEMNTHHSGAKELKSLIQSRMKDKE